MQNTPPRRSLDGVAPKSPKSQSHPQPSAPQPSAPLQPVGAIPAEPVAPTGQDIDATKIDNLNVDQPKKLKKSLSKGKKVTLIISVLLIGLGLIVALVFWYLQRNIVVDNLSGGAASLQSEVDPDLLKGEGDGRINALLIGVDSAAGLADSIMLVSFDPIAKDVVMLSIPRDLYVEIGDFGSAKINAAHAYGEQFGYEGGGPQLLKDTLSEVLDVPIHYHGRLNFKGFEKAIDIIGGVEVEVEEDLYDPFYPNESYSGYVPLHIERGIQQMDGSTALKYARSRKTTSDFDRSRRQQQILLGLRQEVMSASTFTNPARIARLINTLGSNARTDMSIDEITRLIELTEGVDKDNIVQAQLDTSEDNFLTFSNIYGQSVVVPKTGDFSSIREYVRTLMVDSYIKDEAAKVSILNGTQIPGMANQTADLLRSYGYNVVNIDNASDQNYTKTVIFNYNSDNPYTLRYLERRFGVRSQRQESSAAPHGYDIEIVLGIDHDPYSQ